MQPGDAPSQEGWRLDREKVDKLLLDLQQHLDYQDIYEIKKQLNVMNKQGRLLPARIKFIHTKLKTIKEQKKRVGNVTEYVFENQNIAILIALMQLISAFVAELLCIATVSGQRWIWKCFNLFIALKIVAQIDNFYAGSVQDATIERISSGSWQPLIIYKRLKWRNRKVANRLWFLLYTVFRTLYKCVYFYFFPFVVLLFNIYAPNCYLIKIIDRENSVLQQTTVY